MKSFECGMHEYILVKSVGGPRMWRVILNILIENCVMEGVIEILGRV